MFPFRACSAAAICLVIGCCAQVAAAADAASQAHFAGRIRPFLERHCSDCHAGGMPEGKRRLDELTGDFADKAARETWLSVLQQLKAGRMPPADRPRPPPDDVAAVTAWIRDEGTAAELARRKLEGRVPLRRLNRAEYENTIRDLLGIEISLQELLPPDASRDGFDTSAEAHRTSLFLLEKYLEAADAALNVAIANRPQPPLVKKRLLCKDERHVKVTTERVFLHRDDALVFFSSSPWQAVTMSQFYPPDRGTYRFRISARGYQSQGRPVTFQVTAGPMLMGTKSHLVGYFDARPDEPTVIEFVDHLEARSTIRLLPYGLATAQAVNKIGADAYDGPGLAVEWVEVEGPLFDLWPPESHRRIFGDLPQAPAPEYNNRNRVEVVSQDPLADARRILKHFATRAFRRPASDEETAPFVSLVQEKLAEKYSFEAAVRVGLKGVLVSPQFLFLQELPGQLDDFALASRLSYFLWSSLPDEELLALAEQKKLHNEDVLRIQIERMLASPKAAAFTENFVGQWLGLRDIDFTEPDRRLYPEYDDLLKASMVKETHLFFDEVLKSDLSVANFVASDFAMLNERLARHYSIEGVGGWEFRKVPLPPESHRGGVLTMASVLKVTANGTNTSPVVRGAWVLDRILGTPPEPPPAGVPAVDPDIRGATTIREQLAKHRESADCAACHAKIDPPGFALESFDVIGGWRDHYRSVGRGQPVTIDGRRMPYAQGPAVDPSDTLADGRRFSNIDQLKALLLEGKDRLARALTTKLVTYSTGRAPDEIDHPEVERIVGRVRKHDYGLKSLILAIVQSPLFREK